MCSTSHRQLLSIYILWLKTKFILLQNGLVINGKVSKFINIIFINIIFIIIIESVEYGAMVVRVAAFGPGEPGLNHGEDPFIIKFKLIL